MEREQKKYRVGFVPGVFDMFNIRHLNLLRRAKEQCEFLVACVITDDLCDRYNIKKPVIKESDRMAIVNAIRHVDRVVSQANEANIEKDVDAVFLELSWKDSAVWRQLGIRSADAGYDIVYIDSNDDIGEFLPREIENNVLEGGVDNNGIVGYTTGVYDMFHIGHLNILRRAKERCNYLIVGVSTDENVIEYKHKSPVVPFVERVAIVGAIRFVDQVVPQINMDKITAWERLHFNVMFHGDDWKGSNLYNETEMKLRDVGCETVYLPHTDGVSSSLLRDKYISPLFESNDN